MKNYEKALILFGIGGILISGHLDVEEGKRERKEQMDKIVIDPPAKGPERDNVRNYDFDKGQYRTYTDEEIRMMRERQSYEDDGSYIYTPARVVPSRGEEIENYLEDNPEVIEEYHDKYRD